LAFTFLFTRCPLPDFCPRMSQNFAETRKLLLNTSGGPTNWQFLSISFDPEFDQPAVLSSYANYFREGNPDRWLFAAASTNTIASLAPHLDLMVVRDSSGISHNLRTVVLDPQGRIFRQFDGNQWPPQKLAEAMLVAAHPLTNPTPP
jgi:protein SCO1/2